MEFSEEQISFIAACLRMAKEQFEEKEEFEKAKKAEELASIIDDAGVMGIDEYSL